MLDLSALADYIAEVNSLIEEHEANPVAIYL